MPFSRRENPVNSSERRNRGWFRHLFWTPTPREYNEAPEMPKSRPMTDIDIGEKLVVVELYSGYGHDEHTRQNFGEMSRELAGTTLPADYVVGHPVPAEDPALAEPHVGRGRSGDNALEREASGEASRQAAAAPPASAASTKIVSGTPTTNGAAPVGHDLRDYTHSHGHAFPAHEAIAATTADSVAKTEAAQAKRSSDTLQAAATKPMEADELRRQAKIEKRNAKQLNKPIRKQRREVMKRQEQVDKLPRSRRPSRHQLAELLVVMVVAFFIDVPVIRLSLTAVPGSFWEHLVVAVFAGAGFAVFGSLLGWAGARLWEQLSAEHRQRFGWSALAALLLVLAVTIVTLALFRAEELVRLSKGNFHVADPFFFGPLQALLSAATALAAFRYFLADEGREALRRLREETLKLTALSDLRNKFRVNAERLLQATAQAEIDGVTAIVAYIHYPDLEVAEVKSANAHGKFVSDWFNTVFLRDRFQPPAFADDGFVRFVTALDERRFALRRLVARALMALAAGALAVAVLALLLHAQAVAPAGLIVALAFGALGVYVSYLAAQERDGGAVRAFVTSGHAGGEANIDEPRGATTPADNGAETENGADTGDRAEEAIAAAIAHQEQDS